MRILLTILGVLALVGTLAFIKVDQIKTLIKFGETAKAAGPPPEVVATAQTRSDNWSGSIAAVGTVIAARGVTISNEVPGVVAALHFDSGKAVGRGEVLAELDASVERAQLSAAKARLELAQSNLARTKALAATNAVSQAQLDNDGTNVKAISADVAALEAQIAKKSIRAPFAGKVGIRTVNLGQYVNPGTAMTVLQSADDKYIDFTVPQQRAKEVVLHQPLTLTVKGEGGFSLEGAVAAIDPTLDSTTRSIKVRATAKDPDKRLRPGMFVNIELRLETARPVVLVPFTALVHASYGESLFIVEDMPASATPAADTTTPTDAKPTSPKPRIARQTFVRIGETRGDFVEILQGLKGGEEVVSAGAFKLRNGAAILVNNTVDTQPSLNPTVQNR